MCCKSFRHNRYAVGMVNMGHGKKLVTGKTNSEGRIGLSKASGERDVNYNHASLVNFVLFLF